MLETMNTHQAGASSANGLDIVEIRSQIIDIPTVRQHKLSSLSTTQQNYVLVRVRTSNGVEGIGEAATLGGPRWSEESVESIKATVDRYLAPAVLGERADRFEHVAALMDRAAKRNTAAKSAVESALFDAVGKTLGVPASTLLGGAVRDRMRVFWTLASGDVGQEIDEAEQKLAQRKHNAFKVKIGAQEPDADMRRMERLAAALDGRATLIVDANQAWDETTAVRCLERLHAVGVTLVEQPLPAWNVAGMARLRGRAQVPLMADEAIFSEHDALAVGAAGAADVVSLKLVKHGGLLGTKRVAAVAEAAGIGLYGGCLLESSVGAAAHLQVFATLRNLDWHCEHFGPQILRDDLVTAPIAYDNFEVLLPSGPGLGVVLDEEKVRHYAREA
ncbi:mandelate racemase (plasmid) [Azospirillum ramasamyi]|uniref:Mandelate racemase n=2 Tax=Azospirillum ramasamyi TaxID=682998 RepID=A0A2U9SC10_9PROT|nr:mandelate racemase [Azospirillum ramasamyi]